MIGLAAVDCSIDRKICQEYFVRRYPTVMVLHGNRKLSPRLFRGQKSLKALLGFVQVQRALACRNASAHTQACDCGACDKASSGSPAVLACVQPNLDNFVTRIGSTDTLDAFLAAATVPKVVLFSRTKRYRLSFW